jgi:hypothetical protein
MVLEPRRNSECCDRRVFDAFRYRATGFAASRCMTAIIFACGPRCSPTPSALKVSFRGLIAGGAGHGRTTPLAELLRGRQFRLRQKFCGT